MWEDILRIYSKNENRYAITLLRATREWRTKKICEISIKNQREKLRENCRVVT